MLFTQTQIEDTAHLYNMKLLLIHHTTDVFLVWGV